MIRGAFSSAFLPSYIVLRNDTHVATTHTMIRFDIYRFCVLVVDCHRHIIRWRFTRKAAEQ